MFPDVQRSFVHAKPFPHAVIKHFLPESFARAVVQALQQEVMIAKDTDLFRFAQTKDLDGTKSKVLQEVYDLFAAPACRQWVTAITGVKVGKKLGMSGFVYRDGDYLLAHDDRLESRKIAYVYNLSEGFTAADGGSLDLMNCVAGHPTKIVKQIVPTFNTLTLFQVSPRSFHQVAEVIRKDRWSLAGWFHG